MPLIPFEAGAAFTVPAHYPTQKPKSTEIIPTSTYFLHGDRYTRFEWSDGTPGTGAFEESGTITDMVGGYVPTGGFDRDVDAALTYWSADSIYLFKGSQCLKVAVDGTAPEPHAKSIKDTFKNLPSNADVNFNNGIDAALPYVDGEGNHYVWFFSGEYCCLWKRGAPAPGIQRTHDTWGITWDDHTGTIDCAAPQLDSEGTPKDTGYLFHNSQYAICTPSTPKSTVSVSKTVTHDDTDADGNITFAIPNGVKELTVEPWGPGGNGGTGVGIGSYRGTGVGAAGGAGAYLQDTYSPDGTSLTFHIGKPGDHTRNAATEGLATLIAAGGGHGGGTGYISDNHGYIQIAGGDGGAGDGYTNPEHPMVRGGAPGKEGDLVAGGDEVVAAAGGDDLKGGDSGSTKYRPSAKGGDGWDTDGEDSDDQKRGAAGGGGAGPGHGRGGNVIDLGSPRGGGGGGGVGGSGGYYKFLPSGGGDNGGGLGIGVAYTGGGGGGGGGGSGWGGYGAGGGGAWEGGGGGGSQGWSLLRNEYASYKGCSETDPRKPYGIPPADSDEGIGVGGSGPGDSDTNGGAGGSGAVRITWIPPDQ
ncbi:hypothetical protein ACWY4P_48425 [Streptomyces sp. LZ34]